MKAGLETNADLGDPNQSKGASAGFIPPSLDELSKLFPQLEILSLLGRGGMGAVYKARQAALDRFVALKILPIRSGQGTTSSERFNREARALARLDHPNIVAVHDFGQAHGLYYFIMEFVDGASLRQLMHASRLSPREAMQIVPQICDALQYAHDEGVVHRDIKPENVLVDRKGRVKIADFGLAKITEADRPVERLTVEGQMMGTPHYMAPEQVERPQAVDHRADIYSVGVVFYELLTGELPLGKFAPPSKKVQVDVRLDEVVLHALEKEPELRYQKASEVKSDVETIAGMPGAAAQARFSPNLLQPGHYIAERFRDLWPWDPKFIEWTAVPMALLLPLVIALLLPRMGKEAHWLWFLELLPLFQVTIWLFIGTKIRKLREANRAEDAESAEALAVAENWQTPGIALLNRDALRFFGISWQPVTIPLNDIKSLKEIRWFNGTRLWTKVGFKIERRSSSPIRIALPEPVARRWKAILDPLVKGASADGLERRPSSSIPRWVAPVRWTARILSAILLLIFGFFIVGEGMPPIGSQPEGVQFGFAALGVIFAGLIVGWKREGTAALLIASGWVLWHMTETSMGMSPFMAPLPIAVLYACAWWATRGRQTGVLAAAAVALAVALGLGRLFLPTSVIVSGTVTDARDGHALEDAQFVLAGADGRKGPNAESSSNGHFSLYVGWYSDDKALTISAPGYESLRVVLGPRPLGQRRVQKNFQLQPAIEAPPVVVKTFPQSGSSDVDPSVTEITVTFSKEMLTNQMWSFCNQSDAVFPEVSGEIQYREDHRTCVMPVKLKPGETYVVWINCEKFNSFRDTHHQPALPYLLIFQTRP